MTLTEFLLARIAEDDEIAREATNDGHRWLVEEESIGLWPDDLEPPSDYMHFPRKAHAYHAATWDPERVLAECEAKRAIVEDFEIYARDCRDAPSEFAAGRRHAALLAVTRLAAVYADHPDYHEAWRP